MSLSKIFLLVSLSLFAFIGGLGLYKKGSLHKEKTTRIVAQEEIDLSRFGASFQKSEDPPIVALIAKDPVVECETLEQKPVLIEHDPGEDSLPSLFLKGSNAPIVETITYKRHVPWKSRSVAWLIDYANHYKTPLDFIYRSLNGGNGYSPVQISEGARFTVFRKNLNFHFHLIVSFLNCRLRLYYVIPEEKKVVFLKSYQVCLGKKDPSKASGCLTPMGIYQLGERVATFRPKVLGMHKGKKVELITVFGGYWLPFEKAVEDCSEPARGFGIHGTPIHRDPSSGALREDNSSLGHYESDGCIRLAGKDMQELFSVISTHLTFVELVSSFDQSQLLQGKIIEGEAGESL